MAQRFLVIAAGDLAAANFVAVILGTEAPLALGPGFQKLDGLGGKGADGVVVTLAQEDQGAVFHNLVILVARRAAYHSIAAFQKGSVFEQAEGFGENRVIDGFQGFIVILRPAGGIGLPGHGCVGRPALLGDLGQVPDPVAGDQHGRLGFLHRGVERGKGVRALFHEKGL